MLPTLLLAQACVDSYDVSAAWDQSWDIEGVRVTLRHVGITELGVVDIIAFRGSDNNEDWLRDFRGWPQHHPVLGWCHEGFLEGMDSVHAEVAAALELRSHYVVTGHSLGAARALIFAAMMTAAGKPPAQVETFGTPRPGFQQLSKILMSAPYMPHCWKNGHDPVTDVPFLICPDGDGYQRPVLQDHFVAEPPPGALLPFAYHHMLLYFAGLAALAQVSKVT
jgi:hypothetical protein